MLCRWARYAVLLTALLSLPPRALAQALPSTVQVAMPDGVSLATDVWRPLLDDKPRPVLLRRTPYGRAVDFALAQAIVGAGYVLVSQDVRGRGGSQGVFEPFFDDKVDGKATIEWAAKQAWSTGAVATYSNSAEGIVQYMGMAKAPEGLRCAHLGMPTHDAYESMFPGGVWRTELGTRWLTDLGAAPVVELWKSHEVHDAYWDDATLTTAEMATIDHPVFILGGLFDIFSNSQVRALNELKAHVAPSARNDIFLVLGPWTHGGIGLRGQGQLYYPEDTPYVTWADDLLAYVKWCTQNGPRPDFAAVRYYLTELSDETIVDPADMVTRIVARGEWRETTSWPPPGSTQQRLFVHEQGLGAPTASAAPRSIPVDPDASVPSQGGGNLSTAAGPYDQSAIDARPDVMVLATAAVTEITEVIGSPTLSVWVSSATTDIDVIARLELLTPQGKAIALTDGARRGRFVSGFDAVRPLTPGVPTRFDVALGPVALRLPPGHALRVALSGTSSPRYEPNPNLASPLREQPAPVRSTLTLHSDREYPSQLLLPVAKGQFPGAQAREGSDAGVLDADAGRDAGATPDAAPVDEARDASEPGEVVAIDGSSSTDMKDASLASRDASALDAEPRAHGEGGCACSTTRSTPDAGTFVIAIAALLRGLRRRRTPM